MTYEMLSDLYYINFTPRKRENETNKAREKLS
jgi:hypothetical protein